VVLCLDTDDKDAGRSVDGEAFVAPLESVAATAKLCVCVCVCVCVGGGVGGWVGERERERERELLRGGNGSGRIMGETVEEGGGGGLVSTHCFVTSVKHLLLVECLEAVYQIHNTFIGGLL